MEFQPPADADSLDDFLPPGIELRRIATERDVPARAELPAGRGGAFSFSSDRVAIVVEGQTFPEDISLQYEEQAAAFPMPSEEDDGDIWPTATVTGTMALAPQATPTSMVTPTLPPPATATPSVTATVTATVEAAPTYEATATETAEAAATPAAAAAGTSEVSEDGTEMPRAELQRLLVFQVEAAPATDSRQQARFDKQVRIVVDLRQYGYNLDEGGAFFLAYQDPQAPDDWIEVAVTVYQRDGLIGAEVPHFSAWATGWRPEGWTLQWELPSADGFSGAATYAYALQLPPGRAGLVPSLSLSYSNSALNGAIRWVSAGNVASGWSLSQIAVVRTGVKVNDAGTGMIYPNKYRLVFDGAGHKLVASTETINGGTRYYAKDAPHLRVIKYASYWTVESGDGRTYYLGSTSNARTLHTFTAPGVNHSADIEWHMDLVTDQFNNRIVYERDRSAISNSVTEGTTSIKTYASRAQRILYNYNSGGTTAATRIELEYNGANGRLGNVLIYHNTTYPIRQYAFDVSSVDTVNPGCLNGSKTRSSTTHLLSSIVEYGWNLAGTRYALPAVSFTYEDRHNFDELNGADCFIFKHLKKVRNGYGGETEFVYASDSRSYGAYTNTGSGPTEYLQMGHSHYVTQVLHRDGRGNEARIVYARTGGCYNQTSPDYGPRCQVDDDAPQFGVLSGFSDVVATFYHYGGAVANKVHTQYYQDADRFGRPYLEETMSSGNVLLSCTLTTYVITNVGSNLTKFTRPQTVDRRQYGSGGDCDSVVAGSLVSGSVLQNVVEYSYNAYGSVTEVRDRGDRATTADDRKTTTSYYPNTSTWIVNKPAAELLYQGIASPVLRQEKRHFYDANSTHLAAPTKGALTKVLQGLSGASLDGGTSGFITTAEYTYDVYGNIKTIKSPRGYTTTLYYDADYNLYPVKMTNALGHVTTFDVYGFKRADGTVAPINGFQRKSGLLRRVADPNGVAIGYEYDPFGRLHAIFDAQDNYSGFADSDPWNGNPRERYRYWDNVWNNSVKFLNPAGNAPFVIGVEQRPGSWPAPQDTNVLSGFAYTTQTF